MPTTARSRVSGRPVFGVSLVLGACFIAALAAGCTRTRVENPLSTNYASGDETGELDFWFGLPERSAVTNDEALHALMLLADGTDTTHGYEDRLMLAQDRGWVPLSFDEPGDLAARRGIIAMGLVDILDLDGGVMLSVLGPMPRYAHRELMARGIMPASGEWQIISGREFMALITRARDTMNLRLLAEAGEAAANDPDAVRDVAPPRAR